MSETIYETEEQFNKRIDLEARAENLRNLSMVNGGWAEAIHFLRDQIRDARRLGKADEDRILTEAHNSFIGGFFQYVCLSHSECAKKGGLLTAKESARRLRNAQKRIRAYIKKGDPYGIIAQGEERLAERVV